MEYSLSVNQNVLSIIPASGLSYNTQYTVYIDSNVSGYNPVTSGYYSLEGNYSFWFTGPYCPQFTTVTRIRLEVGPAGDNLIDDTIHRMILKNSQDAMELLAVSTGTNLPYNYYGCSWENVPYILRRYVECKTAYDILALIELMNNSGGGAAAQLKTLGDMSISYGAPNAANSAIDPGRKKQLYDCWMEMLRGIKTMALGQNPAVRGYYDASKGFPHPVWDASHNRVIRAVSFSNADPFGPWENAKYWRQVD